MALHQHGSSHKNPKKMTKPSGALASKQKVKDQKTKKKKR